MNEYTKMVAKMLIRRRLMLAYELGLNWKMDDIDRACDVIRGGEDARWFLGYRLLLGLTRDEAMEISKLLQ